MPQAQTTFPAAVSRQVSILAHIGFAFTGIVTTMLGPLLPALKAGWALSDAQAGYLFTAQFAASVVSTMLLTKIIRRLGFLKTLALSYLLLAVGVAGVGATSWAVGLIAVAVYGFGLGLSMPATNLLIAALQSDHVQIETSGVSPFFVAAQKDIPVTYFFSVQKFGGSSTLFARNGLKATVKTPKDLAGVKGLRCGSGSPGTTTYASLQLFQKVYGDVLTDDRPPGKVA